jgi:hypothetical protein
LETAKTNRPSSVKLKALYGFSTESVSVNRSVAVATHLCPAGDAERVAGEEGVASRRTAGRQGYRDDLAVDYRLAAARRAPSSG